MYVYVYMRVIRVETYLERNCTAIHMPAYMRPLISQESISRSAMKPTSQMTTKGVPSITFCLNSCGRDRGRRQMDTDGKSGEIERKTRKSDIFGGGRRQVREVVSDR